MTNMMTLYNKFGALIQGKKHISPFILLYLGRLDSPLLNKSIMFILYNN